MVQWFWMNCFTLKENSSCHRVVHEGVTNIWILSNPKRNKCADNIVKWAVLDERVDWKWTRYFLANPKVNVEDFFWLTSKHKLHGLFEADSYIDEKTYTITYCLLMCYLFVWFGSSDAKVSARYNRISTFALPAMLCNSYRQNILFSRVKDLILNHSFFPLALRFRIGRLLISLHPAISFLSINF